MSHLLFLYVFASFFIKEILEYVFASFFYCFYFLNLEICFFLLKFFFFFKKKVWISNTSHASKLVTLTNKWRLLFYGLYSYLSIFCGLYDILVYKIFILTVPNQKSCMNRILKFDRQYSLFDLEILKLWQNLAKHIQMNPYMSILKLSGLSFGLYDLCWPFWNFS